MTYNTLHIFNDDCLRIKDNTSLLESLSTTQNLFTVFYYAHIRKVRPPPIHRIVFLLESLEDLKENLDQYGIPLYLIEAPMVQSLRVLITKWNINRVTTEAAVSSVGKKNQLFLKNYLSGFGVKLQTYSSNTLYDLAKVPFNISRTEFFKTVTEMEPELPLTEEMTESLSQFSSHPDTDVNRFVPKLEEFGITDDTMTDIDTKFIGGETAATKQLEKLISNRRDTNKVPKVAQLYQHDAISPAIKFGCISVRTIYERISKLEPKNNELTNQIYDGLRNRDYFILIGGNCPNIDNQGSIYTYLLPWDDSQEIAARFQAGRTGYPFVDAAIAQLKREGFIHSSARRILVHILTCDLLWIGWHEGVKMFYKWSLDYNAAICGLSWMHDSKSTWLLNEVILSRIDPIEEAKELDLNGEYIKRYLHELKYFPNEYIHTPWLAPLAVQIGSNCLIGKDYPSPIYRDVLGRFQLCKKRLQVYYNLLRIVNSRCSLTSLRKRAHIINSNNNNNNTIININAPIDSKVVKVSLSQ